MVGADELGDKASSWLCKVEEPIQPATFSSHLQLLFLSLEAVVDWDD